MFLCQVATTAGHGLGAVVIIPVFISLFFEHKSRSFYHIYIYIFLCSHTFLLYILFSQGGAATCASEIGLVMNDEPQTPEEKASEILEKILMLYFAGCGMHIDLEIYSLFGVFFCVVVG